ncbi:hypothetical protein [Methanogenium organophilum]|uniref:Uncharacterized protein n=1 Tax=Methanogenium organophilum TaxID=2199 RepID=A0A9X9S2L9_METOG|nr:hypothetical protein [Methanogenium organophilum]WAI00739.1 hypothetical protein OU421_09945 [Methanogenium organophilum]
MNIENDIFKVVEDAQYAGEFESEDLIRKMQPSGRSGLAVSIGGDEQFLLIFIDGTVEGAALLGKEGNLYGDKAIYLCDNNLKFKIYLTGKSIAESVAAGCRIYDKGHIQSSHLEEIPEIGEQKKGRGSIRLRITSGGEPLAGARVSMRKGRQLLLSEVSGPDGIVGFKLVHGVYDCIIVDRTGDVHKYRIEFNDELIDTVIEI